MNTDLLNKALALCGEIEERQAELKKILSSLLQEQDEPTEPDESDQSDSSDRAEEPAAPAPKPEKTDLRKAFTINDRFRFRRELFGGDDKAMIDVISRLSECEDYADAQQFLADLGWSADNEAAAEFKEIVSTFFNGYRL